MPVSLDDRIAELLARYHLGLIPDREGARLAQIFRDDPPDALERLARACDHLGVSGEQAAELTEHSRHRGSHEPAREYLAGSPLPAHPLADAPANRQADPLTDTSQYHRASKGRP